MNKKILFNYVKDRVLFTVLYILNGLLLNLFFYLSTGSKAEILYPLTISIFIFCVIILIDGYKYYRFNYSLYKNAGSINYDLPTSTNEQKEINQVIRELHSRYLTQINQIQSENRQRNIFFSQWIHNMKTPVSVIDLIIQKNKSDDSPENEVFDNINEENQKLSLNLEQLLSLLRIDDFSKDYVPEPIDLISSITRVINSKKNHFIYNNVFPRFQRDLDKVMVLSDSKWNEVMLEQIVSNAIKYSDSGEESKNVHFTIEQKADKTCLIIRDEGIGIPSYDLNRVFEPFFTGENGRRNKNATGIGLYICSVISEKLGHTLTIESVVGKGTSVKITYLSKL